MKTGKWFEDRFLEDGRKVRCECEICHRPMWLPVSKAGKYLTCGEACKRDRLARIKEARRSDCLTCGATFYPRTTQIAAGGGKYCCVRCAEPTREAGRTDQARIRAVAARKESRAAGLWEPLRGALNPRWRGGKEAYRLRQALKDPRVRAAKRRAYLRANPDKAREWVKRRSGLKTGRIPRGTVQRIGALQKWKCAICRVPIKAGYHVDHIQPLARGGEHAATNLQLLCATCNVRKAAKDPIAYMQERGFLL